MQNHKFLLGTEENDYNDSRVFIAKAALYGFFEIDGQKHTHQYFYAGDEEKVAEFQKTHTFKAAKRWKGLGEMNPDEISMMYYDDDTARLLQVRPDNIDDALALIGQTDWKKDLMLEKGVISEDVLDLTDTSIIGDLK